MFTRYLRSLGPAAAAAVLLAVIATPLPVIAQTSNSAAAPGRHTAAAKGSDAAHWQGTQLKHGRIPSSFPGFTDWGLTIDTAFALAADGTRPKRLAATATAIERNYFAEYATFEDTISANAMSKTLVVARVLREPVRDFGNHNVRRLVLNRIVDGPGFEAGRIKDKGDSDFSNTFGQAFGVMGLARTGGVPQPAVRYLLKQRCSDGFFRSFPVVGETCDESDSPSDVDATALAIQALLTARAHGAHVPKGMIGHSATWLVSVQKDNGSFGGAAGDSNTNSTGLAGQALQATGRVEARKKAAAFVARMQITARRAGNGPAKKDIGAIALNRAALHDALRDGVTSTTRDQFRRSTPQAYFSLVPIPLGELSAP
jgi:hypothetical protein